jgi:hypothetical protein
MSQKLIDRLRWREAERQINPPMVIRRACRFCGGSMALIQGLVLYGSTDLYAHAKCFARETANGELYGGMKG